MPTHPTPFTIGPASAAPGTRATGALDVPARGDEPGSTLPFTVLHGRETGAVLALVAGVHGSEYVPVLALQRLGQAIDPGALRGTIVMVHAANLPSFFGRTIYYSPVDGRNLNRMFPGRPDGSLCERIADVLTREVIARASHIVDLHGGDGNESLRPYSYWITTGDPRVAEGSRGLALAFGLDRIVVDAERPTDAGASIYLSNTAITRGKPAITTETGGLGGTEEGMVALVERGVAGVLRHLGMRDKGPLPLAAPLWITRNVVLRAGQTGMFLPVVDCGQTVEAGETLGTIVDFHGRRLESISAPFAGELLYVVRTPPITAGEPLAMIGASEAAGPARRS